jgi:uncharacterized protein YjbI with pentapeptide repeats
MQDVTLNHDQLQNADLSHAQLQASRLNDANLQGARLDQANLCGVSFLALNLSSSSPAWGLTPDQFAHVILDHETQLPATLQTKLIHNQRQRIYNALVRYRQMRSGS